ncbi:MAG: NUDIX hydrolase [Pseudomonadota bacterium]|nr:NUDIX hydrolase [Pseudomonadota bacterium]MEC9156432.1 NUDIX hydrolase [Pseudomonadota bacterium]
MQPLQRENIRLAATVMLVRDDPSGLQVYMVKRPGRGDFPDLHVFPGGKVDQEDWQPELCPDLADAHASARLGVSAGGLRYWVAVARECFEECGVLLANSDSGPVLLDSAQRTEWAKLRQQLLQGDLAWSEVLRQQKATIASDRLVYFSHWITPPSVPRRFDTRFFLAAMPADQSALADTEETADDGNWVNPSQALENARSGEWQMIEPTKCSLETLSQYSKVEQALQEVGAERHVVPWSPEAGQQGMQPFRAELATGQDQ